MNLLSNTSGYLPFLSALDSLIARLIEDWVWCQDHALDRHQHLQIHSEQPLGSAQSTVNNSR